MFFGPYSDQKFRDFLRAAFNLNSVNRRAHGLSP